MYGYGHVSVKQFYFVRLPIYAVIMFLVGLMLGSKFSGSSMLDLGLMCGGLFAAFWAVFFSPKLFQYMQRETTMPPMVPIIFMVFVCAALVPLVWYMSVSDEPPTFLEDCKYLVLVVSILGIMAGEAAYQNNRWDEMKLKQRLLSFGILALSGLICVFGFPAVKQLCKWLMIYSPESYWAGFALILAFSIVPIIIGILAVIVGGIVTYDD